MNGTAVRLKVFVAGPQCVGKSVISNLLAGVEQSNISIYKPTKGVRILEFDRTLSSPKLSSGFRAKSLPVNVELWDCSGDSNLESCWDAVGRDCNGVLLVVNPDAPGQEKELEQWTTRFGSLKEQQYYVFAQKQSNPSQSRQRLRLGRPLARTPVVFTSIENESEVIRKEFDTFLVNVANAMLENRERDENAVLGI
ncbi:hypothetical protein RI367_005616 [Sorochytrium milnesiophthora]